MAPSRRQTGGAGLLPLLRAVAHGTTGLCQSEIHPAVLHRALEVGLGPVVAHVTGGRDAWAYAPQGDAVRAADLTARILSAQNTDALAGILAAFATAGCRPVLLKGASTALRYYPSPHLRTMADIDLLVEPRERATAETLLRGLGFRQTSNEPPEAFVRRHHSMPFYDPDRSVWIEIHTRLHPLQYPLADAPLFSRESIAPHLSPVTVGGQSADAMDHELQLIYTSTRWLERFDPRRGVFPILDAALLVRTQGTRLDWDWICARVEASWAATALNAMLTYLRRCELAVVPAEVLASLAARDPFSNRYSISWLHHLVTRYVMDGQPFGPILTGHAHEITWATLVRPRSAAFNLVSVPYCIAFPPGNAKRAALRRLGSAVRRAFEARRTTAAPEFVPYED